MPPNTQQRIVLFEKQIEEEMLELEYWSQQ